jgi:hypothetical protein
MSRYYSCPDCFGLMVIVGYKEDGEPIGACWGDPPCGCTKAPLGARRRKPKPPVEVAFYVSPLTPGQQEQRELRRQLGSREYSRRIRASKPQPVVPVPVPPVVAKAPPTFRERIGQAVLVVVMIGGLLWGATSCHSSPSSNGGGGGGGGGNGYEVRCRDGWISHSGGIQGACSHHGGVAP